MAELNQTLRTKESERSGKLRVVTIAGPVQSLRWGRDNFQRGGQQHKRKGLLGHLCLWEDRLMSPKKPGGGDAPQKSKNSGIPQNEKQD